MKREMKKTAMKQLIDELEDVRRMWEDESNEMDFTHTIETIIEKAKTLLEKEKEQIEFGGCPYIGGWNDDEFDDWFNEEYPGNK